MSEFIDAIDDHQPPQVELPRLQIIHLMAWTAATALAFLPHSVQLKLATSNNTQTTALARSAVAAALSVSYGVATGAFLFVTISMLFWRRRGYAGRLEPGHCLAYHGAAQWVLATVAWALYSTADSVPGAYLLYFVPYLLLGVVFFVWFVRLAIRERSIPWKWAFVATVMAPVAAWFAMTFSRLFAVPANASDYFGTMVFCQTSAAGVQIACLVAAMVGDWWKQRRRHWSHWFGVGARLLVVGSLALMYLALWWNPTIGAGG